MSRNTTQDKTHFFPKSPAITLIVPFNLAQIQSFYFLLKGALFTSNERKNI